MNSKDLKASIAGLFIGALIINPPVNLILMAAHTALIGATISATIGILIVGGIVMCDDPPDYQAPLWVDKVTQEEEPFNGQGLA